eukprot:s724_g5.t3
MSTSLFVCMAIGTAKDITIRGSNEDEAVAGREEALEVAQRKLSLAEGELVEMREASAQLREESMAESVASRALTTQLSLSENRIHELCRELVKAENTNEILQEGAQAAAALRAEVEQRAGEVAVLEANVCRLQSEQLHALRSEAEAFRSAELRGEAAADEAQPARAFKIERISSSASAMASAFDPVPEERDLLAQDALQRLLVGVMKAEFAEQKDLLNGFTQQVSAMVQEALQRPGTPMLTPTPLLPVQLPETAASSFTLPQSLSLSVAAPQSPRSPATLDSEDQKQQPNFFRFSTASNMGPVDTEHAGMATPGTADASRRNSIASRRNSTASSSHAFKPGAAKEGEDADMSESDRRQSKVTAKKLAKDRSTTISSLRSTVTATQSDAADKAASSWDSIYLQGNFKEQRKKAEAAAKKLSTINSEHGVSLSPSRLTREMDGEPMSLAESLVKSTAFKVGMPLVILLNLVLLGVEVDVSSPLPPGEDPRAFFIMNSIIVVIFVVEILLKLVGCGCRDFFFGSEKWWNLFDLFIVVLSVFEMLAELLLTAMAQTQMDPSHLRVMRFLRLVRALRGIRVVRLLRYIGALRTIVFSIISTLGSVFWTSLLLVILFYLFGVLIAQIVTDHCRHVKFQPDALDCANEDVFGKLLTYWSSVPESMLTLLMAITGGLSWNDALTPLRSVSEIAVTGLLLYIVITVLAVLNVVTGVFCNMAIESARADKDDIAIMQQIHKHEAQVDSLREIFHEIDLDGSNVITAMRGQKMSSFMQSMDISTNDVFTLFMVIDADGSGEITLEEFVYGCMQLQGPAKGLQIARMSYENTVIRKELKQLRADVKKVFYRLEQVRSVSKEVRENTKFRGRAHSESL